SNHSYLYIEPYEPIVHGTLEIDQPEPWDILVIQIIEGLVQIIKDFFTVVINGSNGFGHPDYNGEPETSVENDHSLNNETWTEKRFLQANHNLPSKKKKTTHTNVYISRINNNELYTPTSSPVTSKSKIYDPSEWKTLNESLFDSKRKNKINQDWADVYTKFIQFKLIYDYVQKKSYIFEKQKDNEINKLIKESIPDNSTTEISRWRKAFNLVVLVIENQKIGFEDFINEIRDLNITFNYLQEVDPNDFETLMKEIVKNYERKMNIY
ncbi:13981_t:CDS:2, partial [Cetraspora pellucida]